MLPDIAMILHQKAMQLLIPTIVMQENFVNVSETVPFQLQVPPVLIRIRNHRGKLRSLVKVRERAK